MSIYSPFQALALFLSFIYLYCIEINWLSIVNNVYTHMSALCLIVAECLHVLCKSQYAKLIENNGDLLRLIRGMPLGQTHKVLHATKIVFKSSTIVKNNIMIMLRKELQSKYVFTLYYNIFA